MSISLVLDHLPLFGPPLEMPLRVQIPGGLFGMKREANERTYSHGGLDLAAPQDAPVFASRSGDVARIREVVDEETDNLRVVVRHMAPGPPFFVTYYLHVKDPMVSAGAHVGTGQCIARVGPKEHLHFEIRQIVNTVSQSDWNIENTEALDPLPFLCRWDKIYHEQTAGISPPRLGDRAPLRAVSVRRQDGIWVFEVGQSDDWPIIPLVAPDEGERRLIALLQDAYMNQKPVRLATRESPFYEGKRIITGARVVGES
jgi:hypothetical protein